MSNVQVNKYLTWITKVIGSNIKGHKVHGFMARNYIIRNSLMKFSVENKFMLVNSIGNAYTVFNF